MRRDGERPPFSSASAQHEHASVCGFRVFQPGSDLIGGPQTNESRLEFLERKRPRTPPDPCAARKGQFHPASRRERVIMQAFGSRPHAITIWELFTFPNWQPLTDLSGPKLDLQPANARPSTSQRSTFSQPTLSRTCCSVRPRLSTICREINGCRRRSSTKS